MHAGRAKLLSSVEVRIRFDLNLVPVEASVVVLGVGGSGAGWLRLSPLCKLKTILWLGCRELAATKICIPGRVTWPRICVGRRALETVFAIRICTSYLW